MSKHPEATMPTTDQQITRTELVEKVFGPINAGELPTSLAAALTRLTEVAVTMQPDDIALNFDMVAGVLSFRCYRRPKAVQP